MRVPEALRRPHKLVAAARAALAEASTCSRLASCAWKGCLDISVSQEQRQRALRIMDALVKHLEASGVGVEVSRERTDRYGSEQRTFVTEAIVGGERVGFALREKQRMHKEPPSPRDAARGWPWDRPTVSYLPSGTLELSLTSPRLEGMRRNWSDGKRQRLEDVLGEFVVGLGLAAAQLTETPRRGRPPATGPARGGAAARRGGRAPAPRGGADRAAHRGGGGVEPGGRAARLRAGGAAAAGRERCGGEADEARRADLEWLLGYADSIDPLLGHRD